MPLSLEAKGDRIKVEIALVQGKQYHDERETERRRELDRGASRLLAGERGGRRRKDRPPPQRRD